MAQIGLGWRKLVSQVQRGPVGQQLEEFFSWISFSFRVFRAMPYVVRYPGETMHQMYILGNQALPLVLLAASFISMVMALEWGVKLEPFGAKLMLGRIISISVIREIGPIITGLMVAGRTGAKIVSEIGNMVLSEQVDAMRAFGIDPIKRLIVPRVVASILVMAPLTVVADALGIIAGWFSAVMWVDIDSQFFWLAIRDGLIPKDIYIGLIKPPFFGLMVGLISAYFGYRIRGGAEGLGRAATLTVMFSSLSVLFTDFILTKIVLSLYG
ncbi:MAG: ABC transporter permease [Calditrichaeota bacterium]|nr:MAG: ABC transporter permease [Calditrichota bacterium]